jgi:hypothetical protein
MKRAIVGIAIAIGLLAFTWGCGEDPALGDPSFQPIHVEIASPSALSLQSMWGRIAQSGGFDPAVAWLEWLRLDYAESGALVSASIRAITDDSRLVQVGLSQPGNGEDGGLFFSGGIAQLDPRYQRPSLLISPVLRAIDLAGSARMIALVGGSSAGMLYSFSSAPMKGDGSQSIPASAEAYRWDGSKLQMIAPQDPSRAYGSAYVYLVCYAVMPAPAETSPANTMSTQVQTSAPAVYFLVPTSLL